MSVSRQGERVVKEEEKLTLFIISECLDGGAVYSLRPSLSLKCPCVCHGLSDDRYQNKCLDKSSPVF